MGPSTQYFKDSGSKRNHTFVMAFGDRVLKYLVLGPSEYVGIM